MRNKLIIMFCASPVFPLHGTLLLTGQKKKFSNCFTGSYHSFAAFSSAFEFVYESPPLSRLTFFANHLLGEQSHGIRHN